jgi:tRNA U34 2-thiouridine synthase MnmA/TrmU
VKALALISGGLDSILAARLIMDQDVEVLGVSFESPFFGAAGARRATDEIGIDLVVIDIGEDILEVIAAPKHGFGKHMNPCIDCHALMVRRAGDRMESLGASFVVTGEVVGQRPKSQMRFGLEAVERDSGLAGLLLRPLSAKLLAPTVPEQEGWVDRERLLGLHGRTRKPQIELARQYGITQYLSPAGGCLLTDENFARALKDLRAHDDVSVPTVKLLSVGRQFRLSERAKLAVGRNHAENEALFGLKPEGALFVKAVDHKGPVGVLQGDANDEDARAAAGIVTRYSDAPAGESVRVRIWSEGGETREIDVVPFAPEKVRGLKV